MTEPTPQEAPPAGGYLAGLAGVLVVGDVINDIIVRPSGPTALDSDTGAEITATPGGSGANQAAWLAALGVPVRLAARVGAADAERQRQLLAGAGVDARLQVDDDRPTGSIAVVVGTDGSRSMFTDRGANTRLDGLPPADLLAGISHLHLSGYALIEATTRSAVAALWQAAARSGLTRSVDVGSAASLGPIGPAFVPWTEGAELVFANLAEGRLVTGSGNTAGPQEVVTRLLEHYPVVVLKLGPDGALVATRAESLTCPPPAAAVVDPTGAGDAFCAGFLARWLAGAPPAEAAAAATAAAATSLGQVGGRPPAARARQATWERLRAAAKAAAATAHAPYSHLRVGAAGISEDGQVVTGCNVENASFGLTLCAECGLVSALRAAGAERLVAMSVVAQDGQPLAPCGRCRQVLFDNGGPALLIDRGPDREPVALGDLLPAAFGADELAQRRAP